MVKNKKRLILATVIELVTRTRAKVRVVGTNRGMNRLTPELYAQSSMDVKNELSVRGYLDV